MFNKPNRTISFLFSVCVFVAHPVVADIATVPINGSSKAVFVTSEKAEKLLAAEDPFIQAMGPLERQMRLQSDQPISKQQLLEFISHQALEWKDAEVQAIKAILNDFSKKTKDLKLPLPAEIQFVRTTGKEEGGAAYCRGTSVVVPTKLMEKPPQALGKTIKHELLHVISNQNPKLRDQMYAVIGFKRCEGFKHPQTLLVRRLTNPDAPRLEHFIELKNDNGPLRKVIPILFSNREAYEGGNFFQYLQFKLQEIEFKDGKAVAKIKDGKPVLWDPGMEPDYHRQIGKNTGYIIHPEEIMADNFVAMIEQKVVPNPEIIESLRALFQTAETPKK